MAEGRKGRAPRTEELAELCSELSLVYRSGIPPEKELFFCGEEGDPGGEAFQTLGRALSEGRRLTEAMTDVDLFAEGFFPEYMVGMLRLGEKTGDMEEVLAGLADHYAGQKKLQDSIRGAFLYPALLLLSMYLVSAALLVFVLPVLDDAFRSLGAELPPFARSMMELGKSLWIVSAVIALIVLLLFVLRFLSKRRPGLSTVLKGVYGSVFGKTRLYEKISSARFTSALALGIRSGMELGDAVMLAADVSFTTPGEKRAAEECRKSLEEGCGLAEALGSSGILTGKNGRRVALGFYAGTVDEAMVEVARKSGKEAGDSIERLVGAIEPAVVIAASVFVGVVVLSVMLPLASILSAVS